jgi:hypothetical protein
MQLDFKEWTLPLSWKGIIFQACLAVAMGKLMSYWWLSTWPKFSWLAFAFWYFAMGWFISGCREYREASLSYFDSATGAFKPRFPKRLRAQLLGFFAAVALAFAAVGVLVQLLW